MYVSAALTFLAYGPCVGVLPEATNANPPTDVTATGQPPAGPRVRQLPSRFCELARNFNPASIALRAAGVMSGGSAPGTSADAAGGLAAVAAARVCAQAT